MTDEVDLKELKKEFYHPNSTCHKCGSKVITDTFVAYGEVFKGKRSTRDHINRVCDNCQFTWGVLPLDHEDYPEELK